MGPLQRHDDAPYVSTGHLPSPEQVRRSVDEAYERYRTVAEGENSRVYPALTRVPAELFGICAVGTSGSVYAAGDAGHGLAIMSVAKPSGTVAPPLDGFGNSVKGQLAARFLARRLGLSLFVSEPET